MGGCGCGCVCVCTRLSVCLCVVFEELPSVILVFCKPFENDF